MEKSWTKLRSKDFRSATPVLDICVAAQDRGTPPPSVGRQSGDRVATNYRGLSQIRSEGLIEKYEQAIDAVLCSSQETPIGALMRELLREPAVSRDQVTFTRIIPPQVSERPAGFVEALVAFALVAKGAGYQGLVVTIDELEIEHRLTSLRLKRLYALVEALTQYLNGRTGYVHAPFTILFAAVGEEGHIGDALIEELVTRTKGECFKLKPRTPRERLGLAERIHRLYADGYEIVEPFDAELARGVEWEVAKSQDSGLVRAFIKRYVAALDSRYGPTVS